jgi:transposase
MVARVHVREISNDDGQRLLRMVRRSSGSVVTWRRAQIVLLSAQGMDVAGIAKVTFTSADRVRDVIHNFNTDGFASPQPKYAGGRPPKFTLPQRQQIKKIALARPTDHGLPISTWSLAKLADFYVAEGVVADISHEGLRVLLREDGRVLSSREDLEDLDRLGLRDRGRQAEPDPGDPTVVVRYDEFGPLNLQPQPGRQWGAGGERPGESRPRLGSAGAGPPTPVRTASGTCSPATTCPPTGYTGTSRPARVAPSSWPSATPALAVLGRRCLMTLEVERLT